MKNRIIYLDLIRITAMLLVVSCHCFGDVSNVSPALISMLTYIEMPCIGLFIAISGALLLPIKEPGNIFIKRRLSKIVVPTIVWSSVYMIIGGSFTVKNVMGMLFHPVGSGILWFMYTIIGLYLLSPIISPWLKSTSRKSVRNLLLIWSFSLCYPIFGNLIETNQTESSYIYYFSGYAGFFVLGYYLRQWGISLKNSSVMFVAALACMIGFKLLLPEFALYNGNWYLSIFCPISVIFYWNIIKRLTAKLLPPIVNSASQCNKLGSMIGLISNLCFGVYFIHIGLVKCSVFDFSLGGGYLIAYILRVALVFSLALFLSYIICRLPLSSYIIGYHKIRKKAA